MDGSLFRILARAARKEPEERFDSMQALADALRDWLRAHGEPERPSQLPQPRGSQMTTRPEAIGEPPDAPQKSRVERKDSPSLDDAIRQSLLGGEK